MFEVRLWGILRGGGAAGGGRRAGPHEVGCAGAGSGGVTHLGGFAGCLVLQTSRGSGSVALLRCLPGHSEDFRDGCPGDSLLSKGRDLGSDQPLCVIPDPSGIPEVIG